MSIGEFLNWAMPRPDKTTRPRGVGVEANPRIVRSLNYGAAILVVIVLVTTAAIVATMRQRAISDAARELESLSMVLADQLDRNFQSIELVEQALLVDLKRESLAGPDDFRSKFGDESTHRMLVQRKAPYPHISALSLRDFDGEIVNSTVEWPSKRGLMSPNPAALLQLDKATALVGPPTRSPVTGKWAIYLAQRVISSSGDLIGTMLGTVQVQYLEDYFSKIRPKHGSSVALFRNDGTLLARHPSSSAAIGKVFTSADLGPEALNAEFIDLRRQSPIDGEDRLIAARRLAHYPISVMMTTTVEEALSGWHTTSLYLAGASTIVVFAIAIIVALGRRQFLGQVRSQNMQLAAALDNISQGLIMLDAEARLLICNRRYAEMYRLPPELTSAGTCLLSILQWRKSQGMFFGDPERQVAHLVARTGVQTESRDMRTDEGRSISIVSASMNGGGWVATHEDITDRNRKEASFRLLFENNPVPMWVFDQGTLEFIAVNQAAVDGYGYTKEQFAALKVTDVRPPQAREQFAKWAKDIPRTDRANRMWQHQTRDGRIIDVNISSQALEYDGRNARLVAVHDVTEQKRATEELTKTRRFLDVVIENVPLPIIVKDVPSGTAKAENCTIALVNKAAEELYGIDRTHCIGKRLNEVFPEKVIINSIRLDAEALASDKPLLSEDVTRFSSSKGTRILASRRLAIRSESGEAEHLLALVEDVTETRENERRIAYMAHHDVLTGLANRAAFDECFAATLGGAAEARGQVSLLCMDLDGFKEINDTYGHSAGDAVLREVAARLKVSGEGAFIARFGGDEFALIVADDTDFAVSGALSSRILAAMRSEFRIGEHRLEVGATIGVSQYPAHGTDPETLLGNADVALYRAKSADAGTVQFFSHEMGAQVRDRRVLQDELRHAVAAGEISVHYQPQCLADGSVIGFEALARWRCPKRGPVSPAVFIEIAEDSGLILALGESVLRQACQEAARWPEPLKVSVNVSPRQFRHGDLPRLVHTVLLESGLPPSRLELEITEGVLIGDFSRAVSVLNRLKALGVDIALDDFGTGYSSLSYLHSFPFDLIKIDRAFVSDVQTNRHSSAIVKAVIGLGRSLGVPVLAEGVETEEQRTFLFEAGCDAVQGYLTGRPAPAEAYAWLLQPDVSRRAVALGNRSLTDTGG
ncbi:MAG: hypothetical protein JWR89_1540 [Tardiphaga sp.]|uniref:EAL domain-containing protein n=1 Tax=Tardiphaga sp. TaxID=1926292 RepID=UPI00262B9648|nr:EAL domain-containing protein [Tardiphaga sp.]MDB5501638.1 hypothetical protein [Tardiphaga sp.]